MLSVSVMAQVKTDPSSAFFKKFSCGTLFYFLQHNGTPEIFSAYHIQNK